MGQRPRGGRCASFHSSSRPLWPRLRPLPLWLLCTCRLPIVLRLRPPTSGPSNSLFPTPGGIFPYSSLTACQITTTLRDAKCFLKEWIKHLFLSISQGRFIYCCSNKQTKNRKKRAKKEFELFALPWAVFLRPSVAKDQVFKFLISTCCWPVSSPVVPTEDAARTSCDLPH